MTFFLRTPESPSFGRAGQQGVVRPPEGMGRFEFISLAARRAEQLMRGCLATIEASQHKPMVVAQLEIATGWITHRDPTAPPPRELAQFDMPFQASISDVG